MGGITAATGGVNILNCANPASIQRLGVIPQSTIFTLGLSVSGNRLFAAGTFVSPSGPKFGIFDVSNPSSPTQSSITPVPTTETNYFTQGVTVAGNRAFQAIRDVGLVIWNVSNPSAPAIEATLPVPGSALDVSCSSDGNYAYVATFSGLTIIDCRIATAPVIVSTVNVDYWSPRCLAQGNYVYLVSSIKGLRVIDVTQPAAPKVIASYDTPYAAFDVRVSGDMIYVADSAAGVQILRLTDKAPPTVVITNPVFDPTFDSPNPTVTVAGAASDNKGIAKVFWANNRGGGGEATGTTDWSTPGVPLYPGENVITVTAATGAATRSP